MKTLCALIILLGGGLTLYADPNKPWLPGLAIVVFGWFLSYLADLWEERKE